MIDIRPRALAYVYMLVFKAGVIIVVCQDFRIVTIQRLAQPGFIQVMIL